MFRFTLKLADIPFEVYCSYRETEQYCSCFKTQEKPWFTIELNQFDYQAAKELCLKNDPSLIDDESKPYLIELNALSLRCMQMLCRYNVFLIHGVAIAVDDHAYLFVAKSGVGKSTHAALWTRNIEGSYILNGDKPLLKACDDKIMVYGSPWQGKENAGKNICLTLKSLCFLERASANEIIPLTTNDAFSALIQYVYIPPEQEHMKNVTGMLSMLSGLQMYRLHCNMENEAALVAYKGMVLNGTEKY